MTQATGVDPQTLHPACYQDLLDGRPLYQRMPDGSFVEIIPGRATHCQTVVGESYLLGWRWKDRELGGSQGHLFVRRFESATQYRLQTTSEPRLFTPRGPLRYHVSPRDVRDQIAQEGLRPSADRTGLGAIFLASLKPVDTSDQLDTWEVDVAGLVLHPDTSTSREEAAAQQDPWYACFESIAPSRLKRLP